MRYKENATEIKEFHFFFLLSFILGLFVALDAGDVMFLSLKSNLDE